MLSSVAGQDHLLLLLPCLPGAHTPTRVPTPPDHPAAHSPQHSLPPHHTHLPHFFPLFFSAVSTHSIPPSHPSTTLKLSLPPTASPVLPPPSHPPPLHHRVPPPPPKRNIPSQPPPLLGHSPVPKAGRRTRQQGSAPRAAAHLPPPQACSATTARPAPPTEAAAERAERPRAEHAGMGRRGRARGVDGDGAVGVWGRVLSLRWCS